jgi:hypothetical protein
MLPFTCVIASQGIRLWSFWWPLNEGGLPTRCVCRLGYYSLRDIYRKVAISAVFQRIIISFSTLAARIPFKTRFNQVLIMGLLFILNWILYLRKVRLFPLTNPFFQLVLLHQFPFYNQWILKVDGLWTESTALDPTRTDRLLRIIILFIEGCNQADLTCVVQLLWKRLSRICDT